ncbi:MAG: hypothetical protein MJY43_04970 [Bacteroidales bacterium]|nr:hypothetical protein [Bacteroidales bacterium]
MDESVRYIQVIVPVKLEWAPWYSACFDVRVGQMVSVTLIGRKYTAVVVHISESAPADIKKILPATPAEGLPLVSEKELELWKFISEYYLCTIGEVFKCAYPAMKVKSEEIAARNRERKELARSARIRKLNASISVLKSRLESNSLKLTSRHNETVTQRLKLERASILDRIRTAEKEMEELKTVAEETQNRLSFIQEPVKPEEYVGYDRIPFYISRIEEALSNGSSILILEPEFDLASSMEKKLRDRFGSILLTFNSRQTASAKRLVCSTVRDGSRPHIVLGTRNAIFLPFKELGLVIVDEEQDISYKQRDNSPRFNARDTASYLCRLFGARLVLGSCAPSLETYYNCLSGKYSMTMDPLHRETGVDLVDLPSERRKNGVKGLFSRISLKRISEADGEIIVVRGWEKEEDIASQLSSLFPGRQFRTLSFSSAKKYSGDSALTIILQADFVFSQTDFRSDEKAFQTLSVLKEKTKTLVVQTSNAMHPVFKCLEAGNWQDLYDNLLSERKEFSLPPYTRLSDVITEDGTLIRRIPMQRGDKSLIQKKKALAEQYSGSYIIDVDPL